MAKKVILVTGASSGMGKEFAKRLINEGHTVVAVARRVEKMEDLKSQGAHTMKMDITQEDDILAVVNEVNEQFGGVDVLVNNAGFGLYGAVEDVPIDDACYQFEVNMFGLARITQAVLPKMREKGAGTIINISSMGGKIYTPLGAWYHATKHAVEGWSDCLRLELAEHNINVVIIEPGIIRTAFADVLGERVAERAKSGAYAELTEAVAASTASAYEGGRGSSPDVISDLVVKAIDARRPRTRYSAGQYARPLMFARKWLGDRLFDRIVMSALNRNN